MERVFSHYETWEDYQCGMYRVKGIDNEEDFIHKSFSLLSDHIKLKIAMTRVINEWPIASEFNLTNKGSNRKSWLGQAACCIEHGAPEYLTRIAWNRLESHIQTKANQSANEVIYNFEFSHNAKATIKL